MINKNNNLTINNSMNNNLYNVQNDFNNKNFDIQNFSLNDNQNSINTLKDNNQNNYSINNELISERISNKSEITYYEEKMKTKDSNSLFDINLTKSEILEKINKIFLNNSTFSKSENDYLITQQKIIEILKQSEIINKNIITISEVDVILSNIKHGQNKFNIIEFINFLIKLCEKLYKKNFKKNQKETFNYFIHIFYINYENILEENSDKNYIAYFNEKSCTLKVIETIITTNIDPNVIKLLLNIYPTLKNIYSYYFSKELNKVIKIENLQIISQKKLIEFAKDFNIIPYSMTESNFITYYNLILKYVNENQFDEKLFDNKKYPNLGRCYRLYMFILLFYHFSIICYYKDYQLKFSEDNKRKINVDTLLFFLERLENTKGLSKYLYKKGENYNINLSFIPDNKLINECKKIEEDEKDKLNAIKEEKEKFESSMYGYNSPFIKSRKVSLISDRFNTLKSKSKNMKGEFICNKAMKKNEFNMNNNNKIIDRNIIQNLNIIFENSKEKKILILQNLLNLKEELIDLIYDNLDGLIELFFKFSKFNDKISYNYMTLSSYLNFLKSADIIISVPDEFKIDYLEIGNQLKQKSMNLGEIKCYDSKKNKEFQCTVLTKNKSEKDYLNKVNNIINTDENKKIEKLTESDATLVFYYLTGYKNYNNKNKIKLQFDKNFGYYYQFGENFEKTFNFNYRNYIKKIKNFPNKMDFFLFLKSFEIISAKLYPNETLNNAFIKLFKDKLKIILPKEFLINDEYIKNNIKKINDEKIKDFLNKISPVIKPLYLKYSDEEENFKFKDFFEFYKNYDIFPEVVNLYELKNIFYTLSNQNNKNNSDLSKENKTISIKNKENENIKNNKINFDLFLQSLALSAMFFNYKDIITDMNRMLFIAERIYHSDALKNTIESNKNFENFFQKIKKIYPINETKENIKIFEKNKIKFDEIYSNNE